MNAFSLVGKTIFVTGASSGIGRQICINASNHGATVIASGRNEAELDKTLELLNPEQQHNSIAFNLYNLDKLSEVTKQLPPLDGFVHSAGVNRLTPLKFIKEEDIRFAQKLNYEAPLLLTQLLLKNRLVKRGGSIVYISSASATVGNIGNSVYAGSKGAINSAARCLAVEVAGLRIRVNCILPGMVETPLTAKSAEVLSDEALRDTEKYYLLGFGTLDDVANAAVFMLADASKWITGTNLAVDGGITCI